MMNLPCYFLIPYISLGVALTGPCIVDLPFKFMSSSLLLYYADLFFGSNFSAGFPSDLSDDSFRTWGFRFHTILFPLDDYTLKPSLSYFLFLSTLNRYKQGEFLGSPLLGLCVECRTFHCSKQYKWYEPSHRITYCDCQA
jgi:hypothetical protein